MDKTSNEGLAAVIQFLHADEKNRKTRIADSRRIVEMMAERIQVLDREESLSKFALGGVIHVLKKENLWQQQACYQEGQTFAEFCRSQFDIGLSQAYYLEKIYYKGQHLGLTEEEVERVGWNIAQRLVKIARTQQDKEMWLKEFDDPDVKKMDVVDKMQDKLSGGKEGEDTTRYKKRHFAFDDTENELVQECLERAAGKRKKMLGQDISESACLILILIEWEQFVREELEP